ncbi:MAG: NAD(P)/FAD-dependent oxidoreductase [Betaproteobacteria bacterium]|nr:NAD(P)/FAD-dependent oxidoreductase [Betaproteobacteria bacterium]MDH4323215.1 NAD(P)/FAD-dependent oxidoreductase [Betaproteobacteria bacterium]MDH5577678.1 NAD(P)/FAD-dependent oxidoreductase [Betaproteobacteria bacterium]
MSKIFDRRDFLKLSGAAAALAATGCATTGGAKARVVVIGGGFGGATAAKYIRMWGSAIEVVMVEREADFVSCPISNLVYGGSKTMADITYGYSGLARYGVQVVRDEAKAVDTAAKTVKLARGNDLKYDRLIVSPGIDFMYDQIAGYEAAMSANRVLHAWKAGPQTVALQRQLAEMRDGGVYVLSVPLAPYRCPPGPYERASQVAQYFKKHNPRAKVLIVDANPDVTSKGKLFKQAWADLYPGMIEFRGNSKAIGVDAASNTLKLEVEDVKGDVLNVVPAQRAGDIAVKAGLITANDRWCGVDWRTTESTVVKGVHVLGDATLSAPGMPKSGSMANQQAKVCAAAVVAMINGREPSADPLIVNTCYSFVSDDEVVHVASVHELDESKKTFVPIKGAGGLSAARNQIEAHYAWAWAQNIWSDMLG